MIVDQNCLENIFLKIPLVSLQYLRSVCKEWKALIEDNEFRDMYAKLWVCSPHLCIQHDQTLYMKKIAGENTEWVRFYDLRPRVTLVCGGERFLCFTEKKEDGTHSSMLVMSLMSFPAVAHVPLPPIDNRYINWKPMCWRVFTPHGKDGLVLLGMHLDFKIACFDEINRQFHLYDSRTRVWLAGTCAPEGDYSPYTCIMHPVRRSGFIALCFAGDDDEGIAIYNVWNDTWNLKKMPRLDIDVILFYLLQFDERGTYILCYTVEDEMRVMLLNDNDDGWKLISIYENDFIWESFLFCSDAMDNIWTLGDTMFNYNCDSKCWTQLGAPPLNHSLREFVWCTKY